jgi:hypothetical protein
MNFTKKSQQMNLDGVRNLDGVSVPVKPRLMPSQSPVISSPLTPPSPPKSRPSDDYSDIDDVYLDNNYLDEKDAETIFDDMGEDDVEVAIQVGDDEPQLLSFKLPPVPGGENQDEIEEPAELEVEDDEDIEVSNDPWQWQIGSFLEWLSDKLQSVPKHSGRDSAGLERAMSYLENVDKEISKAVRSDLNGAIDISCVNDARTEVYDGLERLQKRLDQVNKHTHPKKKNKKKADEEDSGLVKEAQKTTSVGGIVVTVPLLISSIARTCINSMVSAGKDIEDVFDKLAKEYELTSREELETIQLLSDMGYSLRFDRGHKRDEKVDYTSTENFDFAANYPA